MPPARTLGEGYWNLVVARIYTLTPAGTPIAVTPPAATTPCTHPLESGAAVLDPPERRLLHFPR